MGEGKHHRMGPATGRFRKAEKQKEIFQSNGESCSRLAKSQWMQWAINFLQKTCGWRKTTKTLNFFLRDRVLVLQIPDCWYFTSPLSPAQLAPCLPSDRQHPKG